MVICMGLTAAITQDASWDSPICFGYFIVLAKLKLLQCRTAIKIFASWHLETVNTLRVSSVASHNIVQPKRLVRCAASCELLVTGTMGPATKGFARRRSHLLQRTIPAKTDWWRNNVVPQNATPLTYSGYYMYHYFNMHYSTFCPHSAFMCFMWIWEQTAIISLYSINWLVFITETECVYCAVRSAHTVFCVDLRTNSDYFTVQH
jgi:hypothetical protein